MSLALIALTLADAAILPPPAPSLTVVVENVRSNVGRVHVALCPQKTFLKDDCKLETSVPAQKGATTVIFTYVPPGEWAAQAFQDENGNKKVDQNFIGIPREGVGFSRDAKIVFSPPKWRDAMFVHDGKPQTISFSLRYFMGRSGPK
ncbi:DUF2141 domain-containing protein [Novosphingobium sediminicola]|uniref:Uncharacterized protein (DUF2141 family) n=1 Tax=Novosphingobium sediminicola TaxID=563162 RepID=A0A7W6G6T1_9SPHN|nr:DUF2141 domain-containing protein [Novosphingobium sediminicola]MBB3955465.1 uncharacterized protein (DUF2141 family) [Novosphingobium sediminicola]